MPRFETLSTDSPHWKLAAWAGNLEDTSDWSAIIIDPINMTVDITDRIISDGIYLKEDWTVSEAWLNSPYQDWETRIDVQPAPTCLLNVRMIYDLLEASNFRQRTVIQAVMCDVYDCDDCRDLEGDDFVNSQCDHLVTWAMVAAFEDQPDRSESERESE